MKPKPLKGPALRRRCLTLALQSHHRALVAHFAETDTIKPLKPMKTKFLPTVVAKDGKVTFWATYEQRWLTVYASLMLDRDLATLTQRERDRIAAAAKVNGGAK